MSSIFAVHLFFFKVPIHVGVIVNPIIYGITHKAYREAYKILLKDAFKICVNRGGQT